MFGKEKKAYAAPDIEKLSLSDSDLDMVSGGIQKREEINPETNNDSTVQTGTDAFTTYVMNGDVGRGRGRGGGCDGVPYHRMARTFSSGRNSGC